MDFQLSPEQHKAPQRLSDTGGPLMWRYDVGRGEIVAIELTPRRFTADEYRQMIAARVFDQDERLELIDGEIVQMSPIGDRHAACVRRLNELLGDLVSRRAIVDVQDPIIVAPSYAPQPDLALLRT